MIIHTAGCDCSGKSTLVKGLSQKLNYPTKHFDKPNDLEDGKKQYFDFINSHNGDIVCDRLHDGEWIYAPLYRGYEGNYLHEFERELIKKHNYLFVYVKAKLDTIIKRARNRGEDFVKEEHFQTVLDNYSRYVNKQKLPYMVIDTTNSKTPEDVEKVVLNSEKVNNIWNLYRDVSNNSEHNIVLPRGRVDGKYMVVASNPFKTHEKLSTIFSGESVSNLVIDVLKNKNIYEDSWLTSIVPYHTNNLTEEMEQSKHLIVQQFQILKPEEVFALDYDAKVFLENLLNIKVKFIEGGI